MKRQTNLILQLILITLALLNFGCSKKTITADNNKSNFRVIGYLPGRENLLAPANSIDYGKITHLYIAFINPDSLGNLKGTEHLKEVAAIAHAKNVKIMASIGGGGAPAYYPAFLIGEKKTKLIADLVNLAVESDLDGIDVDLEGALIDWNYENFVIDLAAQLRAKNKMITAAIATVYKDQFTDKALAQFDFVNIMSYDKTGPWNLSRPGPHAPYEMAVEDLEYWTKTRGIPKEKLSLGVPFYGYGFGGSAPESISWKNLILQYPDKINVDEFSLNGGNLYYNGIPTIRKKTSLALEKSGGIMIWQLLQDTVGEQSLLGNIHAVIHAK
ncbi:glycosyl hydrolase family 18 protein [Dyadobacter sp. CY345]|uniref:glycosyl hydrolase family 18 protein n=1 Tax=Dyadobacter sp. CY345 TaxID=2909335 RepID=UPI001F167597|nr:glycosyl hydrolase family 18 protein [Dyadobacter sp. CY345]MCF2446123.1 glycosyl hydrolase family 18 protein [Dyadobacter sp. CY345]